MLIEIFKTCEVNVKGNRYIINTEDTFNRLTIKAMYRNEKSKWYAICQCSCGNKVERHVLVRHLITESTKSCGCYNKELCITRSTKHDFKHRVTKDKLYLVWVEMRRRCNTETCKSYVNYGARGITICEEWNNFMSFRNWACKNGYQEDLTIERIDVNGNYEPLNCTWIPKSEQSKNRRMCHFIEYQGLKMTISDWARKIGVSRGTILKRLNKGLPLNEVLKSKTL